MPRSSTATACVAPHSGRCIGARALNSMRVDVVASQTLVASSGVLVVFLCGAAVISGAHSLAV